MKLFKALIAFLPFSVSAQHCGYDFASIIVVRPHLAGDTTVITGLRITLLDSMNLPVNFSGPHFYLFHSNQDPEACGLSMYGFQKGEINCFPFAKDNYVLVVSRSMDMRKYKLLVQDEPPRTSRNRHQAHPLARYGQQVIPLSEFDSYPLCGTYNDEVYPELPDRPAFHPVDIILQPR